MLPAKTPLALLLTASLACIAQTPAFAAPKPEVSWGKANVSLEDYRKDALECGRTAYYADVSQTDHAQAFLSASKKLEAADDHGMAGIGEDELYRMAQLASQSERIRASIRPEKRMRELQAALVEIMETCLKDRGYSQFRLTDEQRKQLGKLPKGSPERHRFLHGIASNPEVLESQVVFEG